MSSSRLYIGKIGKIPKQVLYQEVVKYGQIVDFLMKENFCFVEYAFEQEAQQALRNLDGKMFEGQRLVAEIAKSRGAEGGQISNSRLYIGRVKASKKEIQQLFGQFGEITDLLLKDDFGFVEFKQLTSAQAAIQQLNGQFLNGLKLIVEEAKPRDQEERGGGGDRGGRDRNKQSSSHSNQPLQNQQQQNMQQFQQLQQQISKSNENGGSENTVTNTRLFVGKLSNKVHKSDIQNLFSTYGELVDLLLRDDFAFVEYSNLPSAQRALDELDGYTLYGTKITVQQAKPRPGEDRSHKHIKKSSGGDKRDKGKTSSRKDRKHSSGMSNQVKHSSKMFSKISDSEQYIPQNYPQSLLQLKQKKSINKKQRIIEEKILLRSSPKRSISRSRSNSFDSQHQIHN